MCRVPVLLLVGALGLTACGGGDAAPVASSTATATATATPTTTAMPTTTAAPTPAPTPSMTEEASATPTPTATATASPYVTEEGVFDTDQDLVDLAAGALVVRSSAESEQLANQLLDGSDTAQPGGDDDNMPLPLEFVIELPAPTTFDALGLASPTNTAGDAPSLLTEVEFEGSLTGPDEGFEPLVTMDLPDLMTQGIVDVPALRPIRWLKVRAVGQIDEEASARNGRTGRWGGTELYGFGTQDLIARAAGAFAGRYRYLTGGLNGEPGVNVIDLMQDGATITGCQNVGGSEVDVLGTVTGGAAILTVTPRSGAAPPGTLTAIITAEGLLGGVNPNQPGGLRPYYAAPDPDAPSPCTEPAVPSSGNPVSDALAACETAIVHGINFDVDRATLRPDAEPALRTVLEALQQNPDVTAVIEGHTDSDGSDESNLDLSDRRAAAVITWLADRGVDSTRLTPVGRGEAEPIASNDSASGKAANRRVEVEPC